MIKKILLIILTITFFSCERDDICIDETTPKLIVVFYDNNNPLERKDAPNLKVAIDSLGTFIEVSPISNDSITIPLRVDVDLTKIRLTKQETDEDEITDDFNLNYIRDEVFVSRSCGFKTTYSETDAENLTNNWISSLTINNQTITDETTKHISIFH